MREIVDRAARAGADRARGPACSGLRRRVPGRSPSRTPARWRGYAAQQTIVFGEDADPDTTIELLDQVTFDEVREHGRRRAGRAGGRLRRAAHGGGAGDGLRRGFAVGLAVIALAAVLTLAVLGTLSHTATHDAQFDAGAPVVGATHTRTTASTPAAPRHAPPPLTVAGPRPPVTEAEVRLQRGADQEHAGRRAAERRARLRPVRQVRAVRPATHGRPAAGLGREAVDDGGADRSSGRTSACTRPSSAPARCAAASGTATCTSAAGATRRSATSPSTSTGITGTALRPTSCRPSSPPSVSVGSPGSSMPTSRCSTAAAGG